MPYGLVKYAQVLTSPIGWNNKKREVNRKKHG